MINTIRRLRIIALLLFLTPSISLVGSLVINNYLVSFEFKHDVNYNFKENIPGETVKFYCSQDNNFCDDIKLEKHEKLGQCNLYIINDNFISENGDSIDFDIDEFRKKCLLEGLDDIGLTLQKKEKITQYEANLKSSHPWII